jgi:SHS2 domain-containing protein
MERRGLLRMIRPHHWQERPTEACSQGVESEHFDHGADVGVRGFGATPARAFERAARALFLLLCEDPSKLRAQIEEPIACDAATLEELLVAYLNELIFLSDSRQAVFGRFEATIRQTPGGFHLAGRAWGERFDPKRHEFTVQPKGATFTALKVERRGDEWVAQCVVDV